MTHDLHGMWDQNNKYTGPYLRGHTNLTEFGQSNIYKSPAFNGYCYGGISSSKYGFLTVPKMLACNVDFSGNLPAPNSKRDEGDEDEELVGSFNRWGVKSSLFFILPFPPSLYVHLLRNKTEIVLRDDLVEPIDTPGFVPNPNELMTAELVHEVVI